MLIDHRLKPIHGVSVEKPIPNSTEVLRVEFMAPHGLKRKRDFRVDVEKGLHARECYGGAIALQESDSHDLTGLLPDGSAVQIPILVTRPTALVLLKLLALDDRYRNIRGPAEAEHDREEARTHAALDKILKINNITELNFGRQPFGSQRVHVAQNKCVMPGNEKASCEEACL